MSLSLLLRMLTSVQIYAGSEQDLNILRAAHQLRGSSAGGDEQLTVLTGGSMGGDTRRRIRVRPGHLRHRSAPMQRAHARVGI
ncbi:hypothetical protein C8J57DRAFT_1408096, partial [Mycena rebaudengoi]